MPAKPKIKDYDAELAELSPNLVPFQLGGDVYTPKQVGDISTPDLEASVTLEGNEPLAALLVDESADRLREAKIAQSHAGFVWRDLYQAHATIPTRPQDD